METEVKERPKGLTDKQKRELKRNTPKQVLSNRIKIAQQSEDPSNIKNIKEEIVSIMRHCDLTKQNVIAIFDEEESKREFVEQLDGIS